MVQYHLRIVAVLLALGCLPVPAQQSETYTIQADVFAQAFGACSSANYGNLETTTGQAVAGTSQGLQSGVNAGFLNEQLFDLSPPLPPVVSDGIGENLSETTDNSQVCASWETFDPESGIYAGWLSVGSSPGASDLLPSTAVGPLTQTCLQGSFDYCTTYYVAVQSRNGAALRSPLGSSDGVFVDDPTDVDGDGQGNACDADDDGDGVADAMDPCPCDALDDADQDGFCGNHPLCGIEDNCPQDYNPGQIDEDGNGIGDACDDECKLRVDALGGAGVDCHGIQQCLDVARPDCRILVAAGAYAENLIVQKPVRIEGVEGAALTEVTGALGLPAIRVDLPGVEDLARIEGLTISGATDGLVTVSETEIVKASIEGGQTALRVAAGSRADGPRVTLTDSTIVGAATGLVVEQGLLIAQGSSVEQCGVGARVESGWLLLGRSDIRGSTQAGVRVEDGRLDLTSSLVTGAAAECLWIGETAEADVVFSTISACGTGIELQNPGPGALGLSDSIVHGNSEADLVGVGCDSLLRTATASDCCGVNGDLCADPGFVDPLGGDFRLSWDSPCVDASYNVEEFGGSPCRDRDGHPRLLDGDLDGLVRADMGAHEFEPAPPLAPGTIQGLQFQDRLTLSWQDEPGSARYLVFVATLSGIDYQNAWSCLGGTEGLQYLLASGDPSAGGGFIYVVAGEDASGQRGSSSAGSCAERSNDAICP